MAAPSVRATSVTTTGSTTTSITINKPSGTASGDILYAPIVNGSATSAPSTTPSTAWTLIESKSVGIGWAGVYRLIAGGSEPSNYTWSGATDSVAGCMVAIQGADTSTPEDATNSQANTNSTTVSCGGITTSGTERLIVAVAAELDNLEITNAAWACATDPTSLTEQIQYLSSGGNDTGCGIATAAQASGAGPTGTMTTTLAGSRDNVGFLIAVKPPAGATQIDLTDSGSGTETATVTATVPAADAGSATEVATISATVPLADAGSGTDAIAVSIPAAMSDTGSGTETLTASATVPLAESGSATDALTITATVTFTDSGSATDSFAVSIPKALSDSGSATEVVAVAAVAALAEAGTATEQLALSALLAMSETGHATDALAVQISTPGERPGVLRSRTGPPAGLTTTTSSVGELTTGVGT